MGRTEREHPSTLCRRRELGPIGGAGLVVVSSSESWPRCASGISSKALQGILGRGRAGREAAGGVRVPSCVCCRNRVVDRSLASLTSSAACQRKPRAATGRARAYERRSRSAGVRALRRMATAGGTRTQREFASVCRWRWKGGGSVALARLLKRERAPLEGFGAIKRLL